MCAHGLSYDETNAFQFLPGHHWWVLFLRGIIAMFCLNKWWIFFLFVMLLYSILSSNKLLKVVVVGDLCSPKLHRDQLMQAQMLLKMVRQNRIVRLDSYPITRSRVWWSEWVDLWTIWVKLIDSIKLLKVEFNYSQHLQYMNMEIVHYWDLIFNFESYRKCEISD